MTTGLLHVKEHLHENLPFDDKDLII